VIRGSAVGVTTAVLAAWAHAAASGTALPQDRLPLLVGAALGIGLAANRARSTPAFVAVFLFGQLGVHLLLGGHASCERPGAMAAMHLLAALGTVVLLAAADRGGHSAANHLRALAALLRLPRPGPVRRRLRALPTRTTAPDAVFLDALRGRGPPRDTIVALSP
jgi:hypothetical protein